MTVSDRYIRISKPFNTSNIASVKMLSSRDLKPLAPVFLDIAFFAISLRAFSVKCNLTWTIANGHTRDNFNIFSKRQKQVHKFDHKEETPNGPKTMAD